MTRTEAFEIIKLWERWNKGQKSDSLIFKGIRNIEDDIYDERRKLILLAMKRLSEEDADQK